MPGRLISSHHLRVDSFEGLHDFYSDALGMEVVAETADMLAFALGAGATLVFHANDVAQHQAQDNDFYWKIGITVKDLDAAVLHLQAKGVNTSPSVQFRDIGYMSKVVDPNGFAIELLQQGFQGNEQSVDPGHPIGTQATLAHITLRVTDIAASTEFFGDDLGMRLMSVQPVDEHDFCLYFYAWSDEQLPDPDLTSVANREWLWQRPYTLIELQHLTARGASVHKSPASHAGFDGFGIRAENQAETLISHTDLEVLS